MKYRACFFASLLTAAAMSGGCRYAQLFPNVDGSPKVFVRADEIASVDRRRVDPVRVHHGQVFIDLIIESENAKRRLGLGEVPLPYGDTVYITDGAELIARGEIVSECLYGDQLGIVVRFADRDKAERCAAQLWGEDTLDAVIERSSDVLPAVL